MSTTPTPLNPCPFCGGGETILHVNKGTWNGQRYGEPVSVEVRHWCEPVDGQPGRMLDRVGRDEASAIAAWNRRAALTQGAGAVEPVAHLWRNVIDGRTRVVMPDSIITADASWVVEDSLHTATQLQQAVARALAERDRICGLQQTDFEVRAKTGEEIEALLNAAAIRAKGTHD